MEEITMKKMTKIIALVIALLMVSACCLAACTKDCGEGKHVDKNHDGVCDICGKEGLDVTHTGGTATCEKKAVCEVCGKEYGDFADHVDADNNGYCDVCNKLLDAKDALVAKMFKATSTGYKDEKVYTYRTSIGGLSSLNWNPHTWEENTDNTVMGYINVGFYDFVLNSTGDGYVIVPELATFVPNSTDLFTDVTKEYVGKYGVKSSDSAKAFRIYLNPNATWETGEKITAEDYIYSTQQLLNPLMFNRRSDSAYGGDFSIYGAKKYLYSQEEQIFSPVAGKYTSIEEAIADGKKVYLDAATFWGATNVAEIEGSIDGQWVPWDNETKLDDGTPAAEQLSTKEVVTQYLSYLLTDDNYKPYLAFVEENKDAGYSWDNVGFKAGKDEGSGLEYLDIIIENTLRSPDFFVPYYNSSTWLVKKDLYEKCKVYNYNDGTKSTGSLSAGKTLDDVEVITSVYCSTIDTSTGYGPYKIVSYQLDKEIKFERNANYYGYSDGMHIGQYQMDNLTIEVNKAHATEVLKFKNGELEDLGLTASDMTEFGSSSRLLYTPQTYTRKLTFNIDYNALKARETEGKNKTMLSVLEFRKALSLSIDREEYTKSCTASHTPGYGLVNNMYVLDGVTYRSTDAAKRTLVKLYGLEYGAGKTYATLDEAYQAITGYNAEEAKALFNTAYEYATTHDKMGAVVAAGSANAIYNGTDIVELDFPQYGSDEAYQKFVTSLQEAVTKATQGTKFEGKIVFVFSEDPTYDKTMKAGKTDIVFSTWGGAQFNFLSLLYNCYCDDSNMYEYGFYPSSINVTMKLDLDGSLNYKEFTSDLKNWCAWLAGISDIKPIKAADGTTLEAYQGYSTELLLEIFANLEYEFLNVCAVAPLYYYSSASIDSLRINNAISNYVNLIGYGGIRFTTFNYSDAEWAEYLKTHTLDYTK